MTQGFKIDTLAEMAPEIGPAPINFDIMLMSTLAKDKLGAFYTGAQDDMIKVILGKDDPVKMWQDAIRSKLNVNFGFFISKAISYL